MSSAKAGLKSAKAALDAHNYADAIKHSKSVLELDSRNYFANLFLGRAHDKSGDPDASAASYTAAWKLKPDDDQAWLGLRTLYESQGSKNVDSYIDVSTKLAEIYAKSDDRHRCQVCVDKAVGFAKTHGSNTQYMRALRLQLPTTEFYSALEGRVPSPSHTYGMLVDLTESDERERINRAIGERRTRIGARVAQVTVEVKREVYSASELEDLLQKAVDWTSDDALRREYEEKLLSRAYETLVVLDAPQKAEKRAQVWDLARGMVVIKHPFLLAWQVYLEWQDVEGTSEYDVGVLREFVEFFPENGLGKVLQTYLASDISPFPRLPDESQEEKKSEDTDVQSQEDAIVLMTDGLEDAKESVLAHRLTSEYYLYLEEYDIVVDTTRKGLKLLTAEMQKSGLKLQNIQHALQSSLATALVHYQAPKNHPEAQEIFKGILKTKPNFPPALLGIGLIFEEEMDYSEAIESLTRALEMDPENVRIRAEAAWCKALNGTYAVAMAELEEALQEMHTKDPRSRELRAQTLYRVGWCMWNEDTSKTARKDRAGAYSKFLAAIKTNPNFAPAYTSLGFFYADYGKDKKRGRQCFQKAFELSASEIDAAERLARSFADEGDWEIVEVIAQRAIDSGKLKPPPGSKKKKGVSWPYSAIGIVQMNNQEYSKSIVSFLSALRLRPDDYNSYLGLGESYHNSGRYYSAAKTFKHAEDLVDDQHIKDVENVWFTKYMLANVHRELGEFELAVESYEDVLKTREKEFGVEIALLQTLIEQAWDYMATGFFGRAAKNASKAIDVALNISSYKQGAFSLWKAVGDACSVFPSIYGRLEEIPLPTIRRLLESDIDVSEYSLFAEVDGIGPDQLSNLSSETDASLHDRLHQAIIVAILSNKRAILSCVHDIHAQAVAWYNLGWSEYQAHQCLEQDRGQGSTSKKPNQFLKAAMRCFKNAIEREAGNSEFWNALGVVTSQLNPMVAQHAFVRSLHLNERSAKTWANLGALYLLQNDLDLAEQAFARSQSSDPDFAQAWVGQGVVSLLCDDKREALSHFTHAFEIADSTSKVAQLRYAISTFDDLISKYTAANIERLVQPLFALRQYHGQETSHVAPHHLMALYMERIGDHEAASGVLEEITSSLEAEYEVSESPESLASFARSTSDLARNQLALHRFEAAMSSGETVLDLISDASSVALTQQELQKTRLSALLTTGIAAHYLSKPEVAISHFRTALEATNAAPDVVCLLAEMLWAKGGADERTVARDQLLECMSENPDHLDTLLLIGVMALVDDDTDALAAIKDDLVSWRDGKADRLAAGQLARIEKVLSAIRAVESDGADVDVDEMNAQALLQAQLDIMLAPNAPRGWSDFAKSVVAQRSKDDDPEDQGENPDTPEESSVESTADTALLLAHYRAMHPPPALSDDTAAIGAEELSAAFAGTRRVADAMRSVMLAPWKTEGWDVLKAVDPEDLKGPGNAGYDIALRSNEK